MTADEKPQVAMRTMVLFWMLSLSLIDCAQVSEIIYRNMVADNSSCRKHEVNRMKLASYTHRSQTNFGRKIEVTEHQKRYAETLTHTHSRISRAIARRLTHSLTDTHLLTYTYTTHRPMIHLAQSK